jgi:leader peptidase (prepilin peptidase)/N-methyltransferase
VPIASYLRLRGRCRTCGAPIGRRTLWVEVATPVVFAALAWLLLHLSGDGQRGIPEAVVLAVLAYAALSWLVVAVPILAEDRHPGRAFVALGATLLLALTATALVVMLGGLIV